MIDSLSQALLFKKYNSRWLIIALLQSVFSLEQPVERYWSSEKRIITTIAILDLVSNDYPERCYNLSNSQNGLFSKRWGYSCIYVDDVTPSCIACTMKRSKLIQNGSCDNQCIAECEECLDWWAKDERELKAYSVEPKDILIIILALN